MLEYDLIKGVVPLDKVYLSDKKDPRYCLGHNSEYFQATTPSFSKRGGRNSAGYSGFAFGRLYRTALLLSSQCGVRDPLGRSRDLDVDGAAFPVSRSSSPFSWFESLDIIAWICLDNL
jgi:hypothetical protein